MIRLVWHLLPIHSASRRLNSTTDIMKRLPEDTFTKLCKFIGYGNLKAPVWFIGPEERLLEETEEQIVQHLEIRRRFKPVECLRGVHVRKLNELTCPGDRKSTRLNSSHLGIS